MNDLHAVSATRAEVYPKDALDEACRLAHALEALLASTAQAMPTELERIDVRIAEALAGSLSDQLVALVRSHVAH